MTFAEQLRPLVEAFGGATASAKACGVSRQTINAWLAGDVPNLVSQAGAFSILGKLSDGEPKKAANKVPASAKVEGNAPVDPKEAGENFVAFHASNPPITDGNGKVIAQVRSIKPPLGELALARLGRQPILRPGSKA